MDALAQTLVNLIFEMSRRARAEDGTVSRDQMKDELSAALTALLADHEARITALE